MTQLCATFSSRHRSNTAPMSQPMFSTWKYLPEEKIFFYLIFCDKNENFGFKIKKSKCFNLFLQILIFLMHVDFILGISVSSTVDARFSRIFTEFLWIFTGMAAKMKDWTYQEQRELINLVRERADAWKPKANLLRAEAAWTQIGFRLGKSGGRFILSKWPF